MTKEIKRKSISVPQAIQILVDWLDCRVVEKSSFYEAVRMASLALVCSRHGKPEFVSGDVNSKEKKGVYKVTKLMRATWLVVAISSLEASMRARRLIPNEQFVIETHTELTKEPRNIADIYNAVKDEMLYDL